jgi:hypothetical protein
MSDETTLDDEAPGDPPSEVIERAFGEENRARLLSEYFAGTGSVPPQQAWIHLYRLLLWIDRTIGLAHCYESDKCQPGRPWYARSLAFHGWVAEHLGTTPARLKDQIDWLFRSASADLAALVVAASHSARVRRQREPYEEKGFPEPGQDPELLKLIFEVLDKWLVSRPPEDVQRILVERIQTHVGQENKRKNLIGEGFEDSVAAVLQRIPGIAARYEILARPMLHALPGFIQGPANEKPRQVDLALVRKADNRRILATAKWSIRADREEQFMSDFRDYSRFENLGEDFDYVLLTNEFDAARLVRACERRRENAALFTSVVHVNPEGPVVAYGEAARKKRYNSARMLQHYEQKRLTSLEDWINSLLDRP